MHSFSQDSGVCLLLMLGVNTSCKGEGNRTPTLSSVMDGDSLTFGGVIGQPKGWGTASVRRSFPVCLHLQLCLLHALWGLLHDRSRLLSLFYFQRLFLWQPRTFPDDLSFRSRTDPH